MGKQSEGYNKVDDNPCAQLAKASFKCKLKRAFKTNLGLFTSQWLIDLGVSMEDDLFQASK